MDPVVAVEAIAVAMGGNLSDLSKSECGRVGGGADIASVVITREQELKKRQLV